MQAAQITEPRSRYRDRNMFGERVRGLLLTALFYACVLATLLVQFGRTADSTPPPQAPLTMELLPLAAPPAPVRDVKEGPEQVEQRKARPAPLKPVTPLAVLMTAVQPASPAEPIEPIEAVAMPPVPETSAPKSIPAPPARALSSNARDIWQARLLAHLERYRRFPSSARARREEGVVDVRFRMNRRGQVLAARIVRSSGSSALDKAALETLRRAQPLPSIPAELPDEIELALPVAFFLR